MPSLARAAAGTLLKAGDGGGTEVFTTIAEIVTIGTSGPTVETLDVTNHDSASSYREFIATLIDAGEITFEGNYTSGATQDAIRTDLNAKTKRNFQLVIPLSSPETWAFAGYFTTFNLGTLAVDGKVSFAGTIKVTGAFTVT